MGLSHTVSGDIASFRTPSRVPIESLKFHFLPKQEGSGDPSPTNIRPITGWTGVNGLQLCKNLIQFTEKTSESYGLKWIEYSDGVVEYEGTPTSWSSIVLGTVKLNGITKVYGKIFGDESNVSFNTLYIYDANGTRLGQIGAPWENTTHDDTYVTVDLSSYPTADYIDIRLKRANNNIPMKGKCYAVVTDNLDYLRIPITFPNGETIYGGYVDPVKGEIWKEYEEIVFDGSDADAFTYVNTSDSSGISRHYFNTKVLDRIVKSNSTSIAYSDSATPTSNSFDHRTTICYYIGTPTNQVSLNIAATECDPTAESFNSYLQNHPVHLVYKLATPVLVATFDPITLQAFLDHNNFWSDANDITEVTYAVTESKDILATRKKAQSFNNYFQGELVFELNGDDPPVNGAWVDRVNGMDYRLAGGASYDDVNKIYDFSGRGIGVHDVLYKDPFSIGHHFRIEWDIYFRRAGASNGHFFDLGSLGSADTALGIGLLAKNSSTITFNWKMQGNSSNPFGVSGEVRTNPNTPVEGDTNYTHFVGFHEIIPWNDGYDRLRIMVNRRISRYETQIPKVEYTQWKTANNHFSVGAGVYNWDVDSHPERYDKDYETDVKVRSIKIFKYD